MQDARRFVAYVINHMAVQGPKALKQIVVVYADGTEVRGFVTWAASDALTISDEHTNREVAIHFARVDYAVVHHYDGASQRFE